MKREILKCAGLIVGCMLAGCLGGVISCYVILKAGYDTKLEITNIDPPFPVSSLDLRSHFQEYFFGEKVAEHKEFFGNKPDEIHGAQNFRTIIFQVCFFTGWLTGIVIGLALITFRIVKALVTAAPLPSHSISPKFS